jgi:hypothetical protein
MSGDSKRIRQSTPSSRRRSIPHTLVSGPAGGGAGLAASSAFNGR